METKREVVVERFQRWIESAMDLIGETEFVAVAILDFVETGLDIGFVGWIVSSKAK